MRSRSSRSVTLIAAHLARALSEHLMYRSVLPVLLALPLTAIVAPAFAAGTLTATSDNRAGSILATNNSGDPEQSGYSIDASELFDPLAFNQCVNDLPASACLNSSSAFIGLTGANVVNGFSIDSVLTATKNTSSANQAIADEDILVGFKVTGATAGDPYKIRLQGGRNGTIGTFSLKFKNASNAVLFNAPTSGNFDTTLDLQNGDYVLEIAANITASGSSTGGTFNYSLDLTKVTATPGCGVPGSGSCAAAKATPFCDDAACCTLICSFDPFCCATQWDLACASAANETCYPQAIAGPMIDPKTGRTHRLFSEGGWAIAKGLAAQANEKLVTIRNARENEWIRRNLLNNVPGLQPDEAWIGFNDIATEGTFVWDSGLPVTYTFWALGEPNNNEGLEDFAVMKEVNGRWNDLPPYVGRRAVTEKGYAICGTSGSCFTTHSAGCNDESCCNLVCAIDPFCCDTSWDGVCVSRANEFCATTIAAGPFVNPKTKNRYYVTTSGAWSTAQRVAMDMNGYVGVPNDAAENEWIRLNLANAAVGPTQLWLGLHDQMIEGSFQTVLGPIASYTNWAAGEPNNSNNEDFVILSNTTSGKWNDIGNLFKLRAVIEVPCIGDINSDGKVDAADLGTLLGGWGTADGDLNADGITDAADLALLLGGWGSCGVSNCCSSHGGTGCDQPGCTNCVCQLDPFCCQTQWDAICADEAANECNNACQCGA
jgi:hypothetical protein